MERKLTFEDLKLAVQLQFDEMADTGFLYKTRATKADMWDTYLDSFPPGTNEIYKERREYDCQCCKQFIRVCGNVVAIIDNELVSIWDLNIGGHFQVVADAMSKLVCSYEIRDRFIHYERNLGTDHNVQLLESGDTRTWEHFQYTLPGGFCAQKDGIGSILSEFRSTKDVGKRGLTEITVEALETVLELVGQKSIYRGEEFKASVERFSKLKTIFDKVPAKKRDNFCWDIASRAGGSIRIRNSAIGTLLTDISDGVGLDKAVGSFEVKVAPMNYKRPTALITKGMIDKAQKKVAELGIEGALSRRYAKVDDLTINNVLFADRTAKKAMNAFDELAEESAVHDVQNLSKVEKVPIKTFIEDILPKATAVELMLDNKHMNNLVSLIAPKDPDAKHIFKWGNNFSWAYNGEVTDSIKERVKRAGGDVTGVLRCSLSWHNYDDLDIHVIEPGGNHIFYGSKFNLTTKGTLDVDMNVNSRGSRNAVENITWPTKARMQEGIYKFYVNQYTQRESIDKGFEVELEFEGQVHTFHYNKAVKGNVNVVELEFSKKDGIKILNSLPSIQASKSVWGLNTMKFHKVQMILHSPNHWDGEKTGNKHYFFMLENCLNEEKTRGFFNEFLNEELTEHRKVFEVLGAKMKTEKSDNQLSGLGFSSTVKNSVFCRVRGSFNRTIEIIF